MWEDDIFSVFKIYPFKSYFNIFPIPLSDNYISFAEASFFSVFVVFFFETEKSEIKIEVIPIKFNF